MMKTFRNSPALKAALSPLRRKNKKIGFVPTMGSLHEGHLSLVRLAAKENDAVVVSIFVNPLQFGPKEDFWRYPRDLARDSQMLKKEKTSFLFAPLAKEFYAEDFQTQVSLGALTKPLCGRTRPTHFSGVATVVLKLLNLVTPTTLYLGQKDYQQFRVVQQMVKDMDFSCEVKPAPIVREADGLAMSSRNIFLSRVERREAIFVHRSLEEAEKLVRAGLQDPAKVRQGALQVLGLAPHARLDYLEIVDAQTLQTMIRLKPGSKILVAIAVFFGKTRLIDNVLIKV